jgi:hypothetical protein
MFAFNDSKVGIGKTNPQQDLDISGNMTVSTSLGVGTTAPSQPLHVTGTALVSDRLGVGTTTPSQALDVVGSVAVSGRVGVGLTNPVYAIDVSGAVNATGFVQTTSNSSVSFDMTTTGSGNTAVTQATNVSYNVPGPVVRLEAKDLNTTYVGGNRVAVWGPFVQATGNLQPTFQSSGGYAGSGASGAFVQAVGSGTASGQHLAAPSLTFNMATNGGLTMVCLFRFDGTPSNYERVFDFGLGQNNNNILLARWGTSNNVVMHTYVGSSADIINTSVFGQFPQNEWMVVAYTRAATSGTVHTLYRNGVVIGSGTTARTMTNRTLTSNYIFRSNWSTDAYANISMGALFLYDRQLGVDEFTALNSYLLQGASVLNSLATNVIAINPFTRSEVASSSVAVAPAPTMDVNASLRVHALPSNPMFVFDATTPIGSMVNTGALPAFDVSGAQVTFTRTSSQYVDFGNRTFRIGTLGFTMVARLRFTGTVGSWERIIDFNVTPGSGVNAILVARLASTGTLAFDIYNSTRVGSLWPSTTVSQDEVFTVCARYDPYLSGGTMTLWKNGVVIGTVNNVRAQDRTVNNTWIGRSHAVSDAYLGAVVNCLAVYDRVLTDDEVRVSHQVLSSDVASSTLEVGNRVGKPSMSVTRDGVVQVSTLSTPVTPPYGAVDVQQTSSGGVVAWQGTNLRYGTAPVVRLEAKDLSGAVANGGLVTAWGAFTQDTSTNQPLYYTGNGFAGGQYLQFNNGTTTQFLQNPASLTFNCSTNGGFTAVALARFDDTTTSWDRIFQFHTAWPNTGITMTKRGNSQWLQCAIGNGSTFVVQDAPITVNEWSVFAFSVGAPSGSSFNIYRNGALAATTTSSIALANITTTNNFVAREHTPINGKVSIGAIFVYDRLLAPDEFNGLHAYLLQGAAVLNSVTTNLMTLNPFARSDVGALGTTQNAKAPAYNLDVNANLRVHALPANPMVVVDAFTPVGQFANIANMPVFDVSNALITFMRASSHYLDLGPRTFNLATNGFTIVSRVRFSGTASAWERIFNAGVTLTGNSGLDMYLSRNNATQTIKLDIRRADNNVRECITGTTFAQEQIFNLFARYDPNVSGGTITLWINGVVTGITTGSAGWCANRTLNYVMVGRSSSPSDGYFNGNVYALAIYDRALTDDEMRLAHAVLSTDTPFNAFEAGNRTGKTSAYLSKEGVLYANTMAHPIVTPIVSHDVIKTGSGSTLQWQGTNMRYNLGTSWPPIIRLEAKDLSSTLTNNAAVSAWGAWSQATSANQPIYLSNSGYQNGQYVWVRDVNSHFMSVPSLTWNLSNNGGVTLVVLARQDRALDAANNNMFLDFNTVSNGNTHRIAVGRNANSNGLYFWVDSSGNSDLLTTSAGINVNQWAVYGFSLGATTGATQAIYINGNLAASRITTTTHINRSTTVNYLGRSTNPDTVYNGVSVAAAFAYDRLLSTDEFAALHTYLLSGAAALNSVSTSVLSVNPFARTDLLVTSGQAKPTAYNLDANTSLRVHAVPPNPMYEVDAYTLASPLAFTNTTNLPTFDTSGGFIRFNNTDVSGNNYTSSGGTPNASSRYLNLPVMTYNLGTRGLTIVMRMKFNAITGTSNRSYEYIFSTWNAGKTGLISVLRDWTNQNIFFQVAQPTTQSGATVIPSSNSFPNETVFTIAARYDPGSRLMSLWKDGVCLATSQVTNPLIVQDRTPPSAALGYGYDSAQFHGNLYFFGIYNRALTDDEIRQAHAVLQTDVPYCPLEVGSRTGNPVLQVSNRGDMTLSGNLSALNMNAFRNKIINGDMSVNQRGQTSYRIGNGGTNGQVTLDRWPAWRQTGIDNGYFTLTQASITDLPGFATAMQLVNTNTGAGTTPGWNGIAQPIEGTMIADLAWGTGYGSPVTLSFWAKSSLPGVYGFIVSQGTTTNGTDTYGGRYTINGTNVWEYKTLVIPAPPSGTTWGTNTGRGLIVMFTFAPMTVGANAGAADGWTTGANNRWGVTGQVNFTTTNGATFQLTGVQVEKGAFVTPFEFRPYPVELFLCQRYFYPIKVFGSGQTSVSLGYIKSTNTVGAYVKIPDHFRTTVSGAVGTGVYVENDNITTGQIAGAATWSTTATQAAAYLYFNNANVGNQFPTSMTFDLRGNWFLFTLTYGAATFTAGQVGQAGEIYTGTSSTQWWGMSAELR